VGADLVSCVLYIYIQGCRELTFALARLSCLSKYAGALQSESFVPNYRYATSAGEGALKMQDVKMTDVKNAGHENAGMK